ncbi:MAG: HesA/MoeB/ThiF family protein [Desulfobulbaceae bacterium]|nr:HesA/MoeB/ThiF family protein [Desulfobulbaceae bacterium]
MTRWPEPFIRNRGSLTHEQQLILQESHVAVIGCGGLGGYVIEELVRIGIGRLMVYDPDNFSLSNCNRQLGATLGTIGKNKAEIAARDGLNIHGRCSIIPMAMDFRDGHEGVPDTVQVLVDCLDDIQARRDLAALSNNRKIPLVHGAVNGWYGQVGVQPAGGDLISRLFQRQDGRARNKTPIPELSFTVATVAGLQAAETVKLLLGLDSQLHNNWMSVDLLHCEFEVVIKP